jgi:hypothetical protein
VWRKRADGRREVAAAFYGPHQSVPALKQRASR